MEFAVIFVIIGLKCFMFFNMFHQFQIKGSKNSVLVQELSQTTRDVFINYDTSRKN